MYWTDSKAIGDTPVGIFLQVVKKYTERAVTPITPAHLLGFHEGSQVLARSRVTGALGPPNRIAGMNCMLSYCIMLHSVALLVPLVN